MFENKIRVAFVGVSHWHVPLYLNWLLPENRPANIEITGVSDPSANISKSFGELLSTSWYIDYIDLLDEKHPDFVFAFGMHNKMSGMAHELIDRRIGFTIEKPLGLDSQEVESVLSHAERNHVFCAIPFIWRYSDLIGRMREIDPNDFVHFSFKFIAGPPSRYIKSSPWMLQKSSAGGGCMTNLGCHFIDLALYLTRSTDAEVIGSNYHFTDNYDIETYGTSFLNTTSGASVILETGYAFPMDEIHKRVNRWDMVTKDGYYVFENNLFQERHFQSVNNTSISMDTDSDVYYEVFAKQSISDFIEGNAPKAGLRDMLAVRKILDQMNLC